MVQGRAARATRPPLTYVRIALSKETRALYRLINVHANPPMASSPALSCAAVRIHPAGYSSPSRSRRGHEKSWYP
jgi:hypothetical protein